MGGAAESRLTSHETTWWRPRHVSDVSLSFSNYKTRLRGLDTTMNYRDLCRSRPEFSMGVATREIEAPEDILWEQLSNFGQIKSWHTSAEICEVVEGENNKPGCVRYCAGGGRPPDGSPPRWVKEKLLTLDLAGRHVTYCILDSSYGFQDYKASLSVMPGYGNRRSKCSDRMPSASDPPNAIVHWTFQMRPVPGVPPQELLRFIASIFSGMMYNLERSVRRCGETASASLAPLPKTVPPFIYT
ncbi:hypothetical protein KP509_39G052000 [Ceratopteris richardii]|uniref:Polyketide cyclase/dehydrase and lipid transport superfamily protein n=1 Tax=Ceratopteris richardii TaxID=49495 RepID=A0A8T2Q100_CERRI|nr:hypothetical protein KP509_39G052000 [Ceratopteris richardii]